MSSEMQVEDAPRSNESVMHELSCICASSWPRAEPPPEITKMWRLSSSSPMSSTISLYCPESEESGKSLHDLTNADTNENSNRNLRSGLHTIICSVGTSVVSASPRLDIKEQRTCMEVVSGGEDFVDLYRGALGHWYFRACYVSIIMFRDTSYRIVNKSLHTL